MKEVLKRAKEYSKIKNWLTLAELGLIILALTIMLFSGLTVFLKVLVDRWSENTYFQIALYFTLFWIIFYILFFSLDFYGTFLVEHRFLLSNRTFSAWLKKSTKKGVLSLLLLLVVAELFYFFLRRFATCWWLWIAGGWIVLNLILAEIVPTLIIPLFYKCKPLANKELTRKLLKLSENSGLPIKEVFEINLSKDTKKANAALLGLGNTRRILLSDTLLNNYSDEEIEAVLAHELGHLRLFHFWKLFAFGTGVSLFGFYSVYLLSRRWLEFFGFTQLSDIAAFPVLALILILVGLIVIPFQNSFSRHLEKEADIFALTQIKNSQPFISVMAKLGEQNLSNPSPSKIVKLLLYDHPPISERINCAKNWKTA